MSRSIRLRLLSVIALLSASTTLAAPRAVADLSYCLPGTTCVGSMVLPFEMGIALPAEASNLTVMGDKLLFTARTESAGLELWTTDLTAVGTHQVKDVRPGPDDGLTGDALVVVGGNAYFTAVDDTHGEELWRTDGTAAGTVLVTETVPGSGSSEPRHLTAAGGRLYWQTLNGGVRDLWTTDGTPAGTRAITPATAVVSDFDGIPVPVGDHVFFVGLSGGVKHLAVTDGTDAGTRLLTAFPGGIEWFTRPRYSAADHRVLADADRLFFSAEGQSGPDHGRELWTSDGTVAGTQEVLDLTPGPDDSMLRPVAWWGGRFHFYNSGETERWKVYATDGTPGGTQQTGQATADVTHVVAHNENGLVFARSIGLSFADVGLIDASGVHPVVLGRRAGDVLDEDSYQGVGDGVIHGDTLYVTAKSVQDRTDVVYEVDLVDRRTRASSPGDDHEITSGPIRFGNLLVVASRASGTDSVRVWTRRLAPDPAVVVAASIKGTARVGNTLAAVTKGSDPAARLTYQWRVGGRNVVGAKRASWKVPAAARGARVSVAVTGTRSGHTTTTVVATRAKPVTPGRLTLRVKVTGKLRVARVLRASLTGSTAGIAVRYQWRVAGKAVRGANTRTWRIPRSAKGKKVTLMVRATKPGYTALRRTVRVVGRVG